MEPIDEPSAAAEDKNGLSSASGDAAGGNSPPALGIDEKRASVQANDASSSSSDSSNSESGDSSSSDSDDSSSAPSDSASRGRERSMKARTRRLKKVRQKKQKAGIRKFLDDAAEESDGEGGIVDDEEDEEDGADGHGPRAAGGYVADGFVVAADKDGSDDDSDSIPSSDDSDDGSGAGAHSDSSSAVGGRRRLRKMGGVHAVDEDDIDLIAEAAEKGELNVHMGNFAKRRRLGDVEPSNQEEPAEPVERVQAEDDEYDSEGMDEFIEAGAAGSHAGVKRKKRQQPSQARIAAPDTEQLAEFNSVFGIGSQKLAFSQLFDDDDYAEEAAPVPSTKRKAGPSLKAQYEPTVLAKHLMRPEDVAIQSADMPERLQTLLRVRNNRRMRWEGASALPPHQQAVASHSSFTRAAESSWIADRLQGSVDLVYTPGYDLSPHISFLPRSNSIDATAVSAAVSAVLQFTYDDGYEIPYIWVYKQRQLHEHFSMGTLWSILDLDDEWTRLCARKMTLAKILDNAAKASVTTGSNLVRIREDLLATASERSVEDFAAYCRTFLAAESSRRGIQFSLSQSQSKAVDADFAELFGDDETPTSVGVAGIATKHDLFSLALGTDVRSFVDQVFMPPESLAQNIRSGVQHHHAPQPAEHKSVEDLALEFINSEFASEANVIRAAKHVASLLLSREPYLRAYMRSKYFERVEVITTPTETGRRELDTTHPLFGVQSLRKRLTDFAAVSADKVGRGRNLYDDLVDDEYPSVTADRVAVPACDSLGFNKGWGYHVEQHRHHEYSSTSFARMESRVGGMTQFSVIEQAEKERLATVEIAVDNRFMDFVVMQLATLYLSVDGVICLSGATHSVFDDDAWKALLSPFDDLRRRVLVDCVQQFMIPEFNSEVRIQLRRVANEAIAAEYGQALRRRILQAPQVPCPQPMRKRKNDDDTAERSNKDEEGVASRAPWQRVRCRVLSIAFARRGAGDADQAVVLDERGEVIESVALSGQREQRETALSHLMFQTAPDTIVLSSGGGFRAREMKQSVLKAACMNSELVRKARDFFRTRKQLIQKYGESAPNHSEKRVAEAWREASMDALLEPVAERWTAGKWKYFRPRVPHVHAPPRSTRLVYEDDHADSSISAIILEDEFARVFASSARGKQEFPDYGPVTRWAISLGRYHQDPLAEVAYLWSRRADSSQPGVAAALEAGVAAVAEDLAGTRLHPLQSNVPADLLYAAAERVMVEVTNGSGIDLNLVARHQHLSGLLQFVAGFGPRKAAAFLQGLNSVGNRVQTRLEIQQRGLLADNVFTNAAGFLRVQAVDASLGKSGRRHTEPRSRRQRKRDADDDIEGYHPLDATRIHPFDYDLALLLCQNVDRQEISASDPHDAAVYEPIRSLMEAVQRTLESFTKLTGFSEWSTSPGAAEPSDGLHDLDLVQTAAILAQRDPVRGNVEKILELVKMELRAPFRDVRKPFRTPSKEALFRLLTKETSMTLRHGVVMPVVITYITAHKLEVQTDNRIKGFVYSRETLAHSDADLSSVYKRDQIIAVSVLKVVRENFALELREIEKDELATKGTTPLVDDAFDVDGALQLIRQVAEEDAKLNARRVLESGVSASMLQAARQKTGLVLRAIQHPEFRNVLSDEATKMLSNMPLFSFLFRPSSKGVDHLTLSLKVREPDTVVHIDVLDTDKSGLTEPTALGRKLTIGSHTFSDLDEAIVRYVKPIQALHQAIMRADCFRDADKATVDAEIRQKMAEDSRRAAYLICPNADGPGSYMIAYMLKSSPHHEVIAVDPQGYKWRDKVSRSVREFLADFKARVAQRTSAAKPAASIASSYAPMAPAAPVAAYNNNAYSTYPPSQSYPASYPVQAYSMPQPSYPQPLSVGAYAAASDAYSAANGSYAAPVAGGYPPHNAGYAAPSAGWGGYAAPQAPAPYGGLPPAYAPPLPPAHAPLPPQGTVSAVGPPHASRWGR
jgi:transcriptional accessory protein Tex/SPT6